jgi:uncharacterized membrane-anchored protein YhcB (DUF1043 family)
MILTIILDAIDANAKNSSTTVSSFGIFDTLIQYGALGLVAIAMGAALWFLLKRMIKTEDALVTKLDTLQKDMNDYIRNDQSKMREVIEHNSRAMTDLKEIIISMKPFR